MYFKSTSEGVEIAIRLSPKSSKDKILGICQDSKGDEYLKVSVTAPAEDNKANEALLFLVGKTLKIPKSQLRILRGHTFRNKILLVPELRDLQWDILKGFRAP